MNIRDLRYLVAVDELQSSSRAAAACFVSQPTLSTQIRKLEDELGVALVERAPRKVMLTAIGRDIAERARRIVAEADQLKEAARRSQDPEAGTVRLGLFPTLGPYLLPHVRQPADAVRPGQETGRRAGRRDFRTQQQAGDHHRCGPRADRCRQ